ncbi:MAG: hypothetical protein NPIRA04_07960 [Nitrospirales bacterium]|nr:MAG: hypothetical protein NPIRA04_07960 [Nitrospirales bacterium]
MVPESTIVLRVSRTSNHRTVTHVKGSQQPTAEFQYGKIFNKESGKLPFYLQPEFGGLDGGDYRRLVRPNAADQRLNMDQYNKQVRPPVDP